MNPASPDLLEGEKVYLGLGSNLGQREENLKTALDGLAAMDGLAITAVSSLYETSPLGPQEQGLFLNAATELNVAGP
ncbi:MAG: 2-amino-4-hydroxy-6-hydroxymethyldihydropteridine diphosphokinase, partial [Deltaproteobacteria bacterium]|nr:2-amino-4-hydroxy-6-hydroxymethyldihydropteridine diphosphokinase [Deltaproteobacteria bacterium]